MVKSEVKKTKKEKKKKANSVDELLTYVSFDEEKCFMKKYPILWWSFKSFRKRYHA